MLAEPLAPAASPSGVSSQPDLTDEHADWLRGPSTVARYQTRATLANRWGAERVPSLVTLMRHSLVSPDETQPVGCASPPGSWAVRRATSIAVANHFVNRGVEELSEKEPKFHPELASLIDDNRDAALLAIAAAVTCLQHAQEVCPATLPRPPHGFYSRRSATLCVTPNAVRYRLSKSIGWMACWLMEHRFEVERACSAASAGALPAG